MSEIFMPKMGDAMTEGKVIRWYKKVGDSVKKGEPVLEIETDKVNLDLEAEEDGTIDQIQVEAGATAEVGATLATTSIPGSKPSAKPAAVAAAPVETAAAPQADSAPRVERKAGPIQEEVVPGEQRGGVVKPPAPREKEAVAQRSDPREPQGSVRSSPLARKMAREMGVDLGRLQGSGPAGRIIAADITQAAKGQPAAVGSGASSSTSAAPMAPIQQLQTRTVPLSAMRRTIAKRLVESLGPVPHFFLTVDLDVTQLIQQRGQLNEIASSKVSVNDFVIRATALSLLHHPNVNASFTAEAIQEHGEVHIGVAVSTPEGLTTPVIRNADRKSVIDIAGEVRALAERARNRKLKPDEYQGSTFTISNLGMFGIEEFTAIINPPNAAILAIGAASQQAVVVNGQVVIRDRMKVTMSCDHRVVDGAGGAEFLRTLRQYIEQPLRLIL